MLKVSAACSALVENTAARVGSAGRLISIDSAVSPVNAPSSGTSERARGVTAVQIQAGSASPYSLRRRAARRAGVRGETFPSRPRLGDGRNLGLALSLGLQQGR